MNLDTLRRLDAPGLDSLLRKKLAAQILGISQVSLWRLERDGLLKPVQILPGLAGYRASELEAFMESRPRATLDTARMSAALASPRHGRAGRVPVAATVAAVPAKDQTAKADQAKARRS